MKFGMHRRTTRRARGSSIVETAAALSFMIPLLVLILFVTIEGCKAYLISQSLNQGAREAARNLATNYAQNPNIPNDATAQATYGFSPVRIPGVITDNSQFSATFDTSGSTPSVTVNVAYISNGTTDLAPFPDFGDINLGLFSFNLGSNFQLSASSTYRLE